MNQEGSLTLDQALPLEGLPLHLKNELTLAFLHAVHGPLGPCLGAILSHHFHSCRHAGHHRTFVGSGIQAHKVWAGPRHRGESGRDKRADQNGLLGVGGCEFLPSISLAHRERHLD